MDIKIFIHKLSKKLIDRSHLLVYESDDLSDAGNEVGIAIGSMIKNMNQEQIEEFISGLRHGISLTNDTH
jgi:hypothetical protein